MKKIERSLIAICCLLAPGVLSAQEESWKSISEVQLQLHLLKAQQEIESIKAKAEEDKRKAEEARLAIEEAKKPSGNSPAFIQDAGGNRGPFPGGNTAQGGPSNIFDSTPKSEVELISVYGVESDKLLADVLFGDQLVTMSPMNERGVRWANGWRIRAVDTRKVVLQQLIPNDKDGDATGITVTFALKSAPLAPVQGSSAPAPGGSQPVVREDSAEAARRFGAQPAQPANVNQARQGSPVPAALFPAR